MKKLSVTLLILFTIVQTISLFTLQSCDKCEPESACDTTFVKKPNLYFFPEENIEINVQLDFPSGGKLVKSEPLYNSGWTVQIDTTGLINETYDFLFYESLQPDVWQYKKGWCVKKENLREFFILNLREYGFGKKETDDFIEYWIPILTKSDYYLIYPQTKEIIDKAIQLSLSVKADNILRLFYVIKETQDMNTEIKEPVISKFKREGFYVTEWGVIF